MTAACLCAECKRYLARDRVPGEELCAECVHTGVPLAVVREPITDPRSVEALALVGEEASEVITEAVALLSRSSAGVVKRVGKLLRWGWEADHQGTTQRDKLESELGDVFAVVALLVHNGMVTTEGLVSAYQAKLEAYREDAAGPRQRVQTLAVPAHGEPTFWHVDVHDVEPAEIPEALRALMQIPCHYEGDVLYHTGCGGVVRVGDTGGVCSRCVPGPPGPPMVLAESPRCMDRPHHEYEPACPICDDWSKQPGASLKNRRT